MGVQQPGGDGVQPVDFGPLLPSRPRDESPLPPTVRNQFQKGIIEDAQPRMKLRSVVERFGNRSLQLYGLSENLFCRRSLSQIMNQDGS